MAHFLFIFYKFGFMKNFSKFTGLQKKKIKTLLLFIWFVWNRTTVHNFWFSTKKYSWRFFLSPTVLKIFAALHNFWHVRMNFFSLTYISLNIHPMSLKLCPSMYFSILYKKVFLKIFPKSNLFWDIVHHISFVLYSSRSMK